MRDLTNVRPFKMRFIPWGWRNKDTGSGIYATQPPGEIRIPKDFLSYFDWERWEVQGKPFNDFCTVDHKSIFTTAARFLGYEKLFLEQPDLSPITEMYLDWNTALLQRWENKIKWFVIGDDLAGKDNLLMSAATLRKWYFPQLQRLIELGLEYGCRIVFHSDGAIHSILEDLYRLRIDVLWTKGDMKDLTSYKGMKIWTTEPNLKPIEYSVLDGKFRMYYPDGMSQDFEQEEFLRLLHVLSRRKDKWAKFVIKEET